MAERRKLKALCDEAEQLFSRRRSLPARETVQRSGDPGARLLRRRPPASREINDRLRRGRPLAGCRGRLQRGQLRRRRSRSYEQIQLIDVNFQRDTILERLYDCHMRLGRAIIEARPAPARAGARWRWITSPGRWRSGRATPRRPRSSGWPASSWPARQAYEAGRWDDAAARLGAVYEERPGYLGDGGAQPALRCVDPQRRQLPGDRRTTDLAFEQYRRACALPVRGPDAGQARMDEVRHFLTPTPTPSVTPTITPLPTPTPYIYVPPTAIPTGTPPPPLASFRNQIVFKSDNEEQPGFWVMNPDGTNRRYLGALEDKRLNQQYEALIEREKLSPDGRYRRLRDHGRVGQVAADLHPGVREGPVRATCRPSR